MTRLILIQLKLSNLEINIHIFFKIKNKKSRDVWIMTVICSYGSVWHQFAQTAHISFVVLTVTFPPHQVTAGNGDSVVCDIPDAAAEAETDLFLPVQVSEYLALVLFRFIGCLKDKNHTFCWHEFHISVWKAKEGSCLCGNVLFWNESWQWVNQHAVV